jgi:hypothetical protein
VRQAEQAFEFCRHRPGRLIWKWPQKQGLTEKDVQENAAPHAERRPDGVLGHEYERLFAPLRHAGTARDENGLAAQEVGDIVGVHGHAAGCRISQGRRNVGVFHEAVTNEDVCDAVL